MAKVVIFGSSEIAEIVHFYLQRDSEHEVVGFTVDEAYLKTESFHNLPIVPYEKLEKYYPPDQYKLFIAISYQQVNKLRAEKYLNGKERGYSFISYISSQASYYGTPVGENCFIMENNVIQPFTSIGNNCLLLGVNSIAHHCVINDHCFLTSHVVLGGGVNIGECTFLGLNTTIRNYIKIGKENIIGAGSIILSDTEDKAVYSPGETVKFEVPSNLVRI
ncbi:acetyltransferase [Anabaena sp. UHCC 0204]|uniref:acetyltransferase n=1 Tax=Anabaena sp. UHCC 0204 TaxID=2590009 RepID=UPI00144735BB|nr:acetyltransferase [Anabaena sp. UHCC 0204]MTJ07341.1 acetyltransferase [Anabaena sp. UHCC 0204]